MGRKLPDELVFIRNGRAEQKKKQRPYERENLYCDRGNLRGRSRSC